MDHNKHASAGLDSEAALTICAKNQKVSSSNTRANAAGPIVIGHQCELTGGFRLGDIGMTSVLRQLSS